MKDALIMGKVHIFISNVDSICLVRMLSVSFWRRCKRWGYVCLCIICRIWAFEENRRDEIIMCVSVICGVWPLEGDVRVEMWERKLLCVYLSSVIFIVVGLYSSDKENLCSHHSNCSQSQVLECLMSVVSDCSEGLHYCTLYIVAVVQNIAFYVQQM
jgi:hypothetical protein